MPMMYLRGPTWTAISKKYKLFDTAAITTKANELLEDAMDIKHPRARKGKGEE